MVCFFILFIYYTNTDGGQGEMGARDASRLELWACVFSLFVITGLTTYTSKYFVISIVGIFYCCITGL